MKRPSELHAVKADVVDVDIGSAESVFCENMELPDFIFHALPAGGICISARRKKIGRFDGDALPGRGTPGVACPCLELVGSSVAVPVLQGDADSGGSFNIQSDGIQPGEVQRGIREGKPQNDITYV